MNWFCFKLCFIWRFALASLAHFNWFLIVYVDCLYFTLWKSYDIFWFWLHLVLCICIPALRPENYILVFFNVISKKCGDYSGKSFKEIYFEIYCPQGKRRNKKGDKTDNENDDKVLEVGEDEDIENLKEEEKKGKHVESEKKLLQVDEKKDKLRKILNREEKRAEKRRRKIAHAVDLLLTYCRLFCTFGILVGNVHKQFIPRYLQQPIDNAYDSPDLLMLFTITISLDILLFWLMIFWTFFQQCRLCCKLGLFKFILWLIALGICAGLLMYLPMHFIHEQLDPTWCQILEGEPLNQWLDG